MAVTKINFFCLLLVALLTAMSLANPINFNTTDVLADFEGTDDYVDSDSVAFMDPDNSQNLPVFDPDYDGVLKAGWYWHNGRTVYVIENDPNEEDPVDDRFANMASFASDQIESSSTDWVHRAEFTMGGTMQNVGNLRGQRMYWMIHQCLQVVCPTNFGKRWCGYDKPCVIQNIIWVDNQGNYKSNGWIDLHARAIRHQPTKKLAEPLHEQTAGIYAVMSERPGNCYYKDWNDSRIYKLCNVASHVLVRLPVSDNDWSCAYMSVSIKFKGGDTRKNFDCEATKQHVDNFFNIWVREEFADRMKVKSVGVGSRTFCKMDMEDTCFSWPHCWDNWQENYKPSKQEKGYPYFWWGTNRPDSGLCDP